MYDTSYQLTARGFGKSSLSVDVETAGVGGADVLAAAVVVAAPSLPPPPLPPLELSTLPVPSAPSWGLLGSKRDE